MWVRCIYWQETTFLKKKEYHFFLSKNIHLQFMIFNLIFLFNFLLVCWFLFFMKTFYVCVKVIFLLLLLGILVPKVFSLIFRNMTFFSMVKNFLYLILLTSFFIYVLRLRYQYFLQISLISLVLIQIIFLFFCWYVWITFL